MSPLIQRLPSRGWALVLFVVLLRLALADAFGHGPTRAVLLLDEPTAALDPRSKQYVLARIRRLAKSRTTVIVKHDAAAVKVAERVVRMEGGRVASS